MSITVQIFTPCPHPCVVHPGAGWHGTGILIHFMRLHCLVIPVKVIGHSVLLLLFSPRRGRSFSCGNPPREYTLRVCFTISISFRWCSDCGGAGCHCLIVPLLRISFIWRQIRLNCNGSEFRSSCSINLHNHCTVVFCSGDTHCTGCTFPSHRRSPNGHPQQKRRQKTEKNILPCNTGT